MADDRQCAQPASEGQGGANSGRNRFKIHLVKA